MKKMSFLLVLLSVCSLVGTTPTQQASKKAVIFDVGCVLVEPAKLVAFKIAGSQNFFWYFAANLAMVSGAAEKIRCHHLYPFLRNCMPYDQASCPMYDEFNQCMPQIMVEWMTGRMSCSLIRAICKEKTSIYSSWFANQAERDLMHAMTAMMFTPEVLVLTQKFIPKSVDFVRQCKKEGYKVYILSNWDPESFPLLVQKDPAFFDLFDGIVVSGNCGYVKPDRQIYKYLLATYQLEPNNCFFIDDVIQNVQAARASGITAAQCADCNIDTIKPAFEAWRKASPLLL